tara:strand:- start:4384 stop:4995 length:612 start_codon:yes stop_codon:yes gene_type:complete
MTSCTDKDMIFRFKFQSDLYEDIKSFSTLHRYDDRESLKDAFEHWCEEHKEQIDYEDKILKSHNYTTENDVKMKIFKSIKYYHIRNMNKSKNEDNIQHGQLVTQESKKKYSRNQDKNIKLSKSIVTACKDYINKNWYQENFKPSTYFELFVSEYTELIEEEKVRICDAYKESKLSENAVEFKIKKTFKNQYYTLMKKGFSRDD